MKTDFAIGHNPRSLSSDRLSRLGLLPEPAGYVDGANLYQFVTGSPVGNVDPMGLKEERRNNGDGTQSIKSFTFSQPEMTIDYDKGHSRDTVIAEVTIDLRASVARGNDKSADIQLDYNWHALTDGFQHTIPDRKDVNGGLRYKDTTEKLNWDGKTDASGKKMAKGSDIYAKISLGTVSCDGKLKGTVEVIRDDLTQHNMTKPYKPDVYWTISFEVTLDKDGNFNPPPKLTYTQTKGVGEVDPYPKP